jgi:2-hydroxy-3-keto-5-methylthiopentenyl-1-phosphate phosphatase
MVVNYFIAVDFDGCITKNAFPETGEVNYATLIKMQMKKVIREAVGYKVYFILWTCREDIPEERNYLTEAVEFCKEHNIPIDFVNENPLMNFGRPDLVRKVYADEYWDDKAVSVR